MEKHSSESKNVQEYRRLRAVELHKAGKKQSEIAEILDVSKGAVSQWLKKYREQGIESLYYVKIPRRVCALSTAQVENIVGIVLDGAENYGFSGDVWTAPRVKDVIKTECGIEYTTRHVGRLLKKWGFSRQKPASCAIQKNGDSVREWRDTQWPEIKKSQERETANRIH